MYKLLQQVIFFQGLDTAALEDIARAATRRTLAADAMLFHEGDPADAFFVLLQGRMRLSQLAADGRQVILGFLSTGEGVGIIAAIPHADYPLSVQALEPSVLLRWERATLYTLMEHHPLIAYHTLRMVAGRFVELQTRYRELATERVERRIARALLRLAQQAGQHDARGVLIDMALSRQDLAEMTGTTLYTVSRTLSQWEQRGIIESGRAWVRVCLHHALVAIAEDLPDSAAPPPDPPPCLR